MQAYFPKSLHYVTEEQIGIITIVEMINNSKYVSAIKTLELIKKNRLIFHAMLQNKIEK